VRRKKHFFSILKIMKDYILNNHLILTP